LERKRKNEEIIRTINNVFLNENETMSSSNADLARQFERDQRIRAAERPGESWRGMDYVAIAAFFLSLGLAGFTAIAIVTNDNASGFVRLGNNCSVITCPAGPIGPQGNDGPAVRN
jgi:hypothetical protein